VLNAERVAPAVAKAIDQSWGDVKKPGIVTFVVDTSGSMEGEKLAQAKTGMIKALDNMARNNQVGFLTFSSKVNSRIPVAPLRESRFPIADAVGRMQATGETALYDAIKAGVELTDAAPGEATAIRALVVLTDGQANAGQARLHDLIRMTSPSETSVPQFPGMQNDTSGLDANGQPVAKGDIRGAGLAIDTTYPVQVFFVGIGKDADMQIGRLLAEATGAEFQGATEKDLAKVLEEISKYF
jgi:hypothetical protein